MAIAMATALGRDATWVTLVLAMLLLFHNGVAKFIPAIGLVVPGALIAGVMLVPDWQMPMPIVVWLAMSIVVLMSIGVHILADKRPILSGRALLVVVLAWFVMSGVISDTAWRGYKYELARGPVASCFVVATRWSRYFWGWP